MQGGRCFRVVIVVQGDRRSSRQSAMHQHAVDDGYGDGSLPLRNPLLAEGLCNIAWVLLIRY